MSNFKLTKAGHSPAMLMLCKDDSYNHHIRDLRLYYNPNNSVMVDYSIDKDDSCIYGCTVRQAIQIIEVYSNWWNNMRRWD